MKKIRTRKYEEVSPVEFLLLRERLGLKRYRKTAARNEEEKRILLDLALKKIEDSERDDFIPLGYRRRRLKLHHLTP